MEFACCRTPGPHVPAALGDRRPPPFESVFLAGFECSCHLTFDGRRLDMTEATLHDRFADADYARARAAQMTICRDGVSWVKAERRPDVYDFSSALVLLRAAERQGVTLIWDLMHFGWPDHVDVFAPSFPTRFGRYARAFARWLDAETDAVPFVVPINEMSFLAWAAGDVRCMFPFESARGVELKAQLVRATIEAIEAIRDVRREARFMQPEPVIHIVPSPEHPKTWRRVESDEKLQYQACDMLTGRVWPSLGGNPRYLDIVGVNFYPDNQFMLDGTTIWRCDPRYRPFSRMLLDVARRYDRPMLVSETGAEGDLRGPWLEYVTDECIAAMSEGCELYGITLYPVLNHPGWADGRHCPNGLWDYADESGARAMHRPLFERMQQKAPRFLAARAEMLARKMEARLGSVASVPAPSPEVP